MRALIDSDVTVHAVCNQAERSNPEGEPLNHVLHSVKLQTAKWITDAGGDPEDPSTFRLYLSGPSTTNFRYEVDPEYKGKRPSKPRWFRETREYLINQWGAKVCHGEADDALATDLYRAYEEAEDESIYFSDNLVECMQTVLVSVDKDLDMVPGWHFNPRKEERYWIDRYDGWYNFFQQMLTGDTVDNIKGLASVGPKKAAALLGAVNPTTAGSTLEYAEGLYKVVLAAYGATQQKGAFVASYTDVFQAADLLWMVRTPGQVRGHQVLLELLPGHVSKAVFDHSRAEALKAPPKKKAAPRKRKVTV